MFKQLLNTLTIIVIMFSIVSCKKAELSSYSGDGIIYSTGWNILTYGYTIDFEEFDITKAYSKTYKIINLPFTKKNIDVGMHIVTPLMDDDLSWLLDSKLSLALTASHNKQIFSCEKSLKNWRHGIGRSDKKTDHFFYCFNSDNSTVFHYNELTDNNEPLYLKVIYEPSSQSISANINANIQLQTGGQK